MRRRCHSCSIWSLGSEWIVLPLAFGSLVSRIALGYTLIYVVIHHIEASCWKSVAQMGWWVILTYSVVYWILYEFNDVWGCSRSSLTNDDAKHANSLFLERAPLYKCTWLILAGAQFVSERYRCHWINLGERCGCIRAYLGCLSSSPASVDKRLTGYNGSLASVKYVGINWSLDHRKQPHVASVVTNDLWSWYHEPWIIEDAPLLFGWAGKSSLVGHDAFQKSNAGVYAYRWFLTSTPACVDV